jgi:hypothetical protein
MALQLTWKNVFLQHPPLKFLDTRFRRQEQPPADHAAEIKNCPPPQDIKQLQRFLGMVNFYRHFLPTCAQVLKPLTNLLRGGGPKQWSGPASA